MQCLIDHAPANPSPLIGVLGTEDNEVDWDAKVAKGFAKSHELRSAAFQLRLNHEKIQIAIRTSLTAGAGAKQDHLGVGSGCGEAAGSLCDQGLSVVDTHAGKRSRRVRWLATPRQETKRKSAMVEAGALPWGDDLA